jgi:hypothetical protein
MSAHTVKQPQPLLTRAGIVSAIHVLAALCVSLGAGKVSTWLGAHSSAIASLILALAPLVLAVVARRHVTPVSAPRNQAGLKLVPVGSAAATLDAANALAQADATYPATPAPVLEAPASAEAPPAAA